MYNVFIKDFVSLSFNSERNILTIRFLYGEVEPKKIKKLVNIVNQIVNDQHITLIIDLSMKINMLSDFRTLFWKEIKELNIVSLIIVSKNKFQKTLYNIIKPFTTLNNTVNYRFVYSLDEAIKVSLEISSS